MKKHPSPHLLPCQLVRYFLGLRWIVVQIARCGILLVGKVFPFELCKNNLKFGSGTKNTIDQILDMKRQFLYYYFQDSIFPSQGSLKSFLFKIIFMVLLVVLIL
jgi:hypothetical protein